ncbi:MAG TPA: class I SAM-dependent methyltransferase [Streptosporangiaceae bacterium]|jgi:SAM-dependent methyltransferase
MNVRAEHDHEPEQADEPAAYWDGRYSASERMWSGDPNGILVREAAGLAPGTALDLGCGEGADAVWLAARGWRVTAVDVSQVALDRAARHAAEAGVAERVEWRRHDLADDFPGGRFDLVSAQYLHSPIEMPREELLRRAAAAVAPGGLLVVGSHGGFPPWEENPHPEMEFSTPAEIVADLGLDDAEWDVLRAEDVERHQAGPDGEPHTRTDNVVAARRR